MKIVLFTDTYPPEINGVSTSTKSLFDVLKKNKHDVLVVTSNHFGSRFNYKKMEHIVMLPGIKLKSIYDYRLVNPMAANLINKVGKIVKSFNPDLIHIQTEFGVGIIGQHIANKYNIPLVYTYHTMYEEYVSYITSDHFNRAARAFMRWYAKRMVNKCLEFIAPSIKTKDYMRSIGVSSYINVIPTGIDFSFFSEKIKENELIDLKKSLKIPLDAKVFLSLGRIASEKSIDVVIKGYANYRKKYPNSKSVLLIVGGGPQLDELKELAKTLKIDKFVIFSGPIEREKVNKYYRLGDLFLSASLSETQGLTYMEAMASNLVPVARFDNNLLDVIIDKETGFYFKNEEDLPLIIDKVINLPKGKKNQIILKGKEVIDTYSIDKFYQRVKSVYERAIQKNW